MIESFNRGPHNASDIMMHIVDTATAEVADELSDERLDWILVERMADNEHWTEFAVLALVDTAPVLVIATAKIADELSGEQLDWMLVERIAVT